MNIIGFILISRNPKSRTKSLGTIEKSRKKSSGSEDVFYREEKNGKVSYEFNATYRKPSDSGWVSETRIKPDVSWKTKKLHKRIIYISDNIIGLLSLYNISYVILLNLFYLLYSFGIKKTFLP